MIEITVHASQDAPRAVDAEVAANLLPLLTQRLAAGGAVRLTVRTGSMAPFLQPGDRVTVESAALPSLHRGDILLLAAGAQPLLHRLLGVRWECSQAILCTKGDAARCCDPPFSAAQLLGRVAAVARDGVCCSCGESAHHLAWRPGWCLAALSYTHARTHALPLAPLRCVGAWLLRRCLAGVATAAWRCLSFPSGAANRMEVQ
jgi:hypothetical protein